MKIHPKQLFSERYRAALNLFLGNDELRPAMHSPFIQEQYVFATDGAIILQFEKSKLLTIDFTSHEKAPNALAIIPTEDNMTVVFETQLLRDKIAESRDAVNKRYTKSLETCPDCSGRGEVDYKFNDYLHNTHEIESDCPTCEGGGRIEMIVDLSNNGKLVEEIYENLSWHDTLFATDYIDKIVQVAELLEEKTIKLVHRNSELSLHKFTVGDCAICLMPINKVHEQSVITIIS